jgi:hypothetical protein
MIKRSTKCCTAAGRSCCRVNHFSSRFPAKVRFSERVAAHACSRPQVKKLCEHFRMREPTAGGQAMMKGGRHERYLLARRSRRKVNRRIVEFATLEAEPAGPCLSSPRIQDGMANNKTSILASFPIEQHFQNGGIIQRFLGRI